MKVEIVTNLVQMKIKTMTEIIIFLKTKMMRTTKISTKLLLTKLLMMKKMSLQR